MLWNGRITGISFSNSSIKERWKATLQTMRWRQRVPAVSTNKPGNSAWKSRLRNDMTKMTARILFLKATRWKLVKMTHVLTRFAKGITVFLFFSCQCFEGQFHLISFCAWKLLAFRFPLPKHHGMYFLVTFIHPPFAGPSCSKLGEDNPGLMRNLNSDLKA